MDALTLPHTFTESNIITEHQLLQVARQIGTNWRQIGIFLRITEVKLQEIEANPTLGHVQRVYQMLYSWRKCQGKNATAANLHAKLTALGTDLVPDHIDFLLSQMESEEEAML